MELLAFGDTGWGDELFYATLMTIAVAITAMLIGFLFALIFTPLKLSKNKFLNLIADSYTTVIRAGAEVFVFFLLFFPSEVEVLLIKNQTRHSLIMISRIDYQYDNYLCFFVLQKFLRGIDIYLHLLNDEREYILFL